MKRLLSVIITLILAGAVIGAQGPLTNALNIGVRVDSNGYLLVAGNAAGTDGPLTALANARVRVDSNGYLMVALASGGGTTLTTSASLAAALNDETGTGLAVFQTSPTLVTPTLGVATATSINGNILTTGSSTYTGTAGQTYTFPTTTATIARTDAANTFTGVQTMTNASLTTPTLTGTVIGTYTLGGTPTLASAAGVPYVGGIAAGYKLARGETALGGTNPTAVSTSLTTITACSLTIKATAAPGVSTSVVTYGTSSGTLNMYGWKVTSSANPTLIASTGTDTIGWVCIGT